MERLAILVGLATAVETVAASGSASLIPRWTGGYRQADWTESSIPFLELALLFAVVVYVFETYLDVRQYSRIKQRGGVVPPELRVSARRGARRIVGVAARRPLSPPPPYPPPSHSSHAQRRRADEMKP